MPSEHPSSDRESDKVVQRGLRCYILPAYADEAFRRFKLDVIEDQGALDGPLVTVSGKNSGL